MTSAPLQESPHKITNHLQNPPWKIAAPVVHVIVEANDEQWAAAADYPALMESRDLMLALLAPGLYNLVQELVCAQQPWVVPCYRIKVLNMHVIKKPHASE